MVVQRVRDAVLSVAVMGSVWMAVTPAALIGKMSTALGFDKAAFSLDVDALATKIFTPVGGSAQDNGKNDLMTAFNAAWAAVLIIMIGVVVIGIVRFMSGSRGAGERIATVLGGAVGMLVAINILA